MNWKGLERNRLYSSNNMEGLKKTTKYVSCGSWCPDRGSSREPPKSKSTSPSLSLSLFLLSWGGVRLVSPLGTSANIYRLSLKDPLFSSLVSRSDKLLLVLASTVILCSESRRTLDHILLSHESWSRASNSFSP
jgi:hypothetical protein